MITAAMVKELRIRTKAGIMECKQALTEAGGDIDAAAIVLRKAGLIKADKKAGRVAAEGVVVSTESDNGNLVSLVEVNCETDFVAKNPDFLAFTAEVARVHLMEADIDAQEISDLILKLGENIHINNSVRVLADDDESIGTYIHNNKKIGVLVHLSGGDSTLAKDIAMHIAANNPVAINIEGIPSDVLDAERAIYTSQAADSGKPEAIIEKMINGKLNKFIKTVTLEGQPFVKNPDITVGQLLTETKAEILSFTRYEVGEGVEKKTSNFADEVQEQIDNSKDSDAE